MGNTPSFYKGMTNDQIVKVWIKQDKTINECLKQLKRTVKILEDTGYANTYLVKELNGVIDTIKFTIGEDN